MPRVTIIFPSIRDDEYYDMARKSILGQSLKDIEVIEDRKVRGNNADSLNACLDKASGELVTFCYDDDISMIDKCMIFHLYAKEFPDIDIFFSSHLMINDKTKLSGYFKPPEFDFDLFKKFGNYISTACCAIRRESIGSLRFNPDFSITHEYLFFYELAERGAKFKMIDVPVSMVRIHKGQMTSKRHDDKVVEHEELRKYLNNKDIYSCRRYNKDYLKNIASHND